MTLKLALQAVLADRTAEPRADEPPDEIEGATAEIEDADGETVEEPTVAELAMAMGTFAGRAVAEPTVEEPAVAELPVAELAVAMGALAEPPVPEPPATEPPAPERTVAEPVAAEPLVAEPAAAEPVAAESAVVEPAVAEPVVAKPRVAVSLEQAVVAVLGLGSTGLPTAIALRGADARVIAIDRSTNHLEEICSGRAKLPGSVQEELGRYLVDGGFALTDDVETLAAAEYILICVPTPVDRERRPNPEALREACAAVVCHARRGQTIVLTSTTYVGGTRELLVEPLEERGLRVGEDLFVAFAPERSDPGVPEHEQLQTPRVVGAVTERCYERASKLLSPVCQEVHRVCSPDTAEMVKLYENTFRAVNIALAFEIADACRAHGLDAIEVTDAAATKPFGFMAHYPSAGVGGGCIGADPHHLTQPLRRGGSPATITEEALRKVAARPRRVVWRAQELLIRTGRQLSDARVLVVGAAYKPGIDDSCQAPAVEIISRLQAEGVQVEYHDPLVPKLKIDGELMCSVDPDPRRDASGFGPEDYALAIVVTIHPGHDYGWLRRVPEVLDCTYRTPAGRRRYVL